MNNLYIDYENGPKLGRNIKDKSKNLRILLDDLNKLEEKFSDVISTEKDNKKLKELKIQTEIIKKLNESVEETGDFLIKVSKAYKEAIETYNRKIS